MKVNLPCNQKGWQSNMSSFIDLTGKIFGNLKVLYLDKEKTINTGKTYWICECQCRYRTLISKRQDTFKRNKDNKCPKCESCYCDLSGEYGIGYTYDGSIFYFDLEDYDVVSDYKWKASPDGKYIFRYINNSQIEYLHRKIMSKYENIKDKTIDHIDHITIDNRKINLRVCENYENLRNNKVNRASSGYKGVYYNKRDGNWRVRISLRDKKINIGTFDNLQDAVIARIKAEKEYYNDFRYKDNDTEIESELNIEINNINSKTKVNKNIKELKSVAQYTKDNEYIKSYSSLTEAELITNCNYQHIRECCEGIRKTHKGYKWKYDLERTQIDE